MNHGETTSNSLPLGNRFNVVTALLNSELATDRIRGWSETYQAYRSMIEREIRVQTRSTFKSVKTVGPGESATDITSKVYEKVADKLLASRLKKRDGSFVSWDSEAGLKKYIDRIVNNLINDSGRERLRSKGLVKDPKTGEWIPRVLPSDSRCPENGEPVARSGDRPSKYDSEDFWTQWYTELERREGKVFADQFREWLRLWMEQSDWHRRWIVLSEYTFKNHKLTQEPDAIRVSFGRTLRRLQKERILWDRFLVNFPRQRSPESSDVSPVIPDIQEDDDNVRLPEAE